MRSLTLLLLLVCFSSPNTFAQASEFKYKVEDNTNWIQSDSIYNGHNYEYYHKKYKNATIQRNIGLGISVAGIAILTGGLIAVVSEGVLSSSEKQERVMLIGFVTTSVGVPIWISGNLKKSNNKKAMKQAISNSSLTFGITYNGVGLVYNFNCYMGR